MKRTPYFVKRDRTGGTLVGKNNTKWNRTSQHTKEQNKNAIKNVSMFNAPRRRSWIMHIIFVRELLLFQYHTNPWTLHSEIIYVFILNCVCVCVYAVFRRKGHSGRDNLKGSKQFSGLWAMIIIINILYLCQNAFCEKVIVKDYIIVFYATWKKNKKAHLIVSSICSLIWDWLFDWNSI